MINGLFLLAWTGIFTISAFGIGRVTARNTFHHLHERVLDDLDHAVNVMANQQALITQMALHIDAVDAAWQADRDRLTAKGIQ